MVTQSGILDTNGSEVEGMITALSSQVESTIILGNLDDEETHYSVFLANDGALLGCLALPKTPPRRC